MAGDESKFGGEFSDEGVARLRARVSEKLKEFMGDYTDDTLVEYVIVLLKNGRRKDEAKGELNVFLGDDSDTFVSWLWDHLGSHLSLYVQPSALHADRAPNVKSSAGKQAGKSELQHTSPESEKKISDRTSVKRHNREGNGLERDKDENIITLSRNSLAENVHSKDYPRHRADRTKLCRSPRPITQKKRRQTEAQPPRKRKVSETISAPKRLLQFAVREAVGTSRPAEPSLKRVRSVISTSTEDISPKDRPRRTRQVTGLRADMSAAIKAVTDAVKDLSKDRPSRNVFDRLEHPTLASNIINQEGFRDIVDEADFVDESEDLRSTYDPQNDGMVQQDGSTSSFEDNPIVASDFGVGYDDYDDVMRQQRVTDMSGLSRGKLAENSLQFQYGATNNSEGRARRPHQDRLTDMPSKSFKIASSANMNTLRIPQYQESREGSKLQNLEEFMDTDALVANSEVWMTKENNSLVGFNGHAQPGMDPKHELQTTPAPIGLYPTGGPTEDADSRTIFLSNVHFAATKDSLSRHFNKFGEVLKVIILTDPATGQPKGSAYVEFMRKEAAEHALSLDGTSFMSRFLKVVRKSSVQPEVASLTTRPRVARASPFTVPRFSKGPFARGIPALYRSRIPSKPVARSFQWKRGATLSETSNQASNSIVPPPSTRSLTYVRTEPKANGSSDTA